MRMNSGKRGLIVSGNKYDHLRINIGNDKINESRTVKLLGIITKYEFKVEKLISNVFTEVQIKAFLIMKIRKYLDFSKLRNLFKIYFQS